MKLLETKEQLTLNELLRIAYEYGNDNADMPTDSECVEKEFSEWLETSAPLFKKLIIPRVSGSFCAHEHLPVKSTVEKCHKCGEIRITISAI